jgi:hypothetical protein
LRDSSRSALRRALAIGAPLLGPIAYATYWFVRNGDALQPIHAQSYWYRELRFPLITLGNAVALGLQGIGDDHGLYWTADVALTAVLIIPLAFGWRAIRGSYLVYVGISLLVPLAYPLPERPLLSVPRFAVVLFPLFWAFGIKLERHRTYQLTVVVFLIGYAFLASSFMNWGFVF